LSPDADLGSATIRSFDEEEEVDEPPAAARWFLEEAEEEVVAEAAWFAFDDFIPMRVSSTVNGSGYPRRVNSVYMLIIRSVSV